ncbi:KRAB [Mytilus edulis]|uniref:KRAB n=1 Tax=Mytilus edulis TaxID=6550 RepID=A0A8S3SF60_MYTED|nr:KRAB [Mytilus edulis]
MEEETVEGSDDSEKEEVEYHRCNLCVYGTKRKFDLKRHKNRVHENQKQDSVPDDSKTYRYLCHVCGLMFQSRSGLSIHIKDKHTLIFRYKCSTCGDGFNRLWDFRGHVNLHNNIRTEKCPLCSKQFAYKNSLNVHIKANHSKEKEVPSYLCSTCGCGYKSLDALREHRKVVHEGRLLSCICGKQFKWRSSQKYHLSVCKLVQRNT